MCECYGRTGKNPEHNRMKWQDTLAALLFAVVYTQSPLYYSNQNQYFLAGAAQAGQGELSRDWLANTADPVPVFTAFVSTTFRWWHPFVFQVVFFLALVAYAWLMLRFIKQINPRCQEAKPFWMTWALFLLTHAGIARWLSVQATGADYLWFFQCGLANQYILGPGLQPSVAGVLLLWALWLGAKRQSLLAMSVAAAANILHTTYLLPAALLVLGFMVQELIQRQWKLALLGGVLALLIVLPSLVYNLSTFPSGTPEQFAEAQRILAEIRIPHHSQPHRWFDWVALLQLVWLLLGWWLLRGTALFVPVAVALGIGLVGTAAVLATANPTLSLLFPWRITAVLVPLATVVLVARLGSRFNLPNAVNLALMVAMILGTAAVYWVPLGYQEPRGEDAALQYVREHHEPGHVYLVPVRFPKPSQARGVYSNTFTAAPSADRPVSFEMARFRLYTLAPLYVDFKAIPYRTEDVLEWFRRVELAERWFKQSEWTEAGVLNAIRAEGITHVIVPNTLSLSIAGREPLTVAGLYRIYDIRPQLEQPGK